MIYLYLFQGEDRIYLNVRSSHRQSSHSTAGDSSRKSSWKNSQHRLLFGDNTQIQNESVSLASSGSKQWTTITIPHNYIGSSWPIRVRIKDLISGISENFLPLLSQNELDLGSKQ